MSERTIGWALVGVQAVLLAALIFVPGRDDWATPGWLRAIGNGFGMIGIVVAVVASLRLGRSLTPTPVPTAHGELTTNGLYRWVRHPIYTGVLAIVVGIVLRSASLVHLAIGIATWVFFDRKARWEEARLAEHYSGYAAYASVTPRFVPRPWR